MHSGAPYLSSAFVDANFEFYGRKINWIAVQGSCEITPPATAWAMG